MNNKKSKYKLNTTADLDLLEIQNRTGLILQGCSAVEVYRLLSEWEMRKAGKKKSRIQMIEFYQRVFIGQKYSYSHQKNAHDD